MVLLGTYAGMRHMPAEMLPSGRPCDLLRLREDPEFTAKGPRPHNSILTIVRIASL